VEPILLLLGLLFALHVLWGVGLPIPEESVLLVAAAVAVHTELYVPIIGTCALGIAVADTLAYMRGRAQATVFTKFGRGKKFIAQSGPLALFTSRALIAVRAIVPYMAGALRMNRFQFHAASLAGAVVSSALFIAVGGLIYGALPQTWAGILWTALVAVVTGVLVGTATRAHAHLWRDTHETD
jgi:membrane protein DedA with SNARE-associated domain